MELFIHTGFVVIFKQYLVITTSICMDYSYICLFCLKGGGAYGSGMEMEK